MNEDTNRDPIEALRQADPAHETPVDQEGLAAARERAITRAQSQATLPSPRAPRLTPVRAAGGLAVASGCAVAGILLLGGGGPGSSGGDVAYAGEAIEIAEANPRFLIDDPAWGIKDVDVSNFDVDRGSMEFRNGEKRVLLDWIRFPEEYGVDDGEILRELPTLEEWYAFESRCASPDGVVPCATFIRDFEVEIAGRPGIASEQRDGGTNSNGATLFQMDLFALDGISVSMYLYDVPPEEIDALLASFVQVDVETWLAALPEQAVEPLDRPEVVDEMLADVPVPDEVDVEALKESTIGSDRYSVGADITSAVACTWLDQWAVAREDGDDAAMEEAAAAMETSHDWDILIEMNEEGGWSQTVWQYAREMRHEPNEVVDSSGTETLNGRTFELSPSYASGLGCDSLKRTFVEDQPNYAKPIDAIPVDEPTMEALEEAKAGGTKPPA